MPTPLETTFRRFLAVLTDPDVSVLPGPIQESCLNHLARAEISGSTLCFAGPLREDMLDLLMAWLQSTKQKPMRRGAHTTPRHAEQLGLPL
jgi:hypothetical protein